MNILRLARVLMLPMAIFMPLWIAIGRGFFGAGGWAFFITIPLGVVMLIGLIVLFLLTKTKQDHVGRSIIGGVDASMYLSLYIALFGVGFFLVDSGDTEESVGSVATEIFGSWFGDISSFLSEFFFLYAICLTIVLFVVLIYERVTKQILD